MPNNTDTQNVTLTNTDNVVNAVKYIVRTTAHWTTFVAENGITREMIGSTSKVLASLAYPEDAPVQTETIDGRKTRTRYGNAVQAAAAMLKKVIEDEDAPVKPTALRVSLSGEGGGSAKVPADHPLYPQIIAFLADQLG